MLSLWRDDFCSRADGEVALREDAIDADLRGAEGLDAIRLGIAAVLHRWLPYNVPAGIPSPHAVQEDSFPASWRRESQRTPSCTEIIAHAAFRAHLPQGFHAPHGQAETHTVNLRLHGHGIEEKALRGVLILRIRGPYGIDDFRPPLVPSWSIRSWEVAEAEVRFPIFIEVSAMVSFRNCQGFLPSMWQWDPVALKEVKPN
mmetsp:Transcript_10866/g.26029  ORF Transcript_10866/g.26029 Transcript_10866/m.26029 type:complete len:201 (+) Transcript_10866:1998-2600(+)